MLTQLNDKLDNCLLTDFICIEDLDNMGKLEETQKKETEEALFHLINHFVQRNKKALFSSKKNASSIGFEFERFGVKIIEY